MAGRHVVVGVVVGAGIGAGAGALVARERRGRGALLGAAAGAGAGALAVAGAAVAAAVPRTPADAARRAARVAVRSLRGSRPVLAWWAQTTLEVVLPALDQVADRASVLLDQLEPVRAGRRR